MRDFKGPRLTSHGARTADGTYDPPKRDLGDHGHAGRVFGRKGCASAPVLRASSCGSTHAMTRPCMSRSGTESPAVLPTIDGTRAWDVFSRITGTLLATDRSPRVLELAQHASGESGEAVGVAHVTSTSPRNARGESIRRRGGSGDSHRIAMCTPGVKPLDHATGRLESHAGTMRHAAEAAKSKRRGRRDDCESGSVVGASASHGSSVHRYVQACHARRVQRNGARQRQWSLRRCSTPT